MNAGTVLADDESPVDHRPLGVRATAVGANAIGRVLANRRQDSGFVEGK